MPIPCTGGAAGGSRVLGQKQARAESSRKHQPNNIFLKKKKKRFILIIFSPLAVLRTGGVCCWCRRALSKERGWPRRDVLGQAHVEQSGAVIKSTNCSAQSANSGEKIAVGVQTAIIAACGVEEQRLAASAPPSEVPSSREGCTSLGNAPTWSGDLIHQRGEAGIPPCPVKITG